jgi:hypothetical protein
VVPDFRLCAAGPWADENPAQKIDYQPLNVDHICSGISDIYLGKDWESGQAQKLPYKGHKDV